MKIDADEAVRRIVRASRRGSRVVETVAHALFVGVKAGVPMAEHVDIVFDGPPGPEGNRFIEVEDASGRSIAFGEWIERQDRRWVLRITAADFQKPRRIVDVAEVQAALDRVAERVRREGPGNGRM
jgi:hypothetical protein